MINFILYCTMSRQFRLTFRKIFGLKRRGSFKSSFGGYINRQSPLENIYIEKYLMVPLAGNNNRVVTNITPASPPVARPGVRTKSRFQTNLLMESIFVSQWVVVVSI